MNSNFFPNNNVQKPNNTKQETKNFVNTKADHKSN